jgi:Superinfection immunity protein
MHHETNAGFVLLGFWIIVGFVTLYFVPAIVAFSRKHNSKVAILVVNFVFGWSLVGWVIALIWACTGNAEGNRQLDWAG